MARPRATRCSSRKPGRVTVKATVAFSPDTPLEPAYGGVIPVGGRRHVGDTVIMRETLSPDPVYQRGQRLVEVVVNGRVAASREVPADGREHAVEFSVPIERSSWIAVRQFPQLHTNPVNVLVAGQPIRASRASARGPSPASINSGGCARARSRRPSAPTRKRPTKKRGRSTAGLRPSRRRSGEQPSYPTISFRPSTTRATSSSEALASRLPRRSMDRVRI